ncbi:MAG: hypothetical protein OXC60_18495, partial [Litoreibacter sp.]|nr:hypothetical protein [Litoreibacter sp.]
MEGGLDEEAEDYSSKTISLEALRTDLGPKSAASLIGKKTSKSIRPELLVPRHEDLLVGDIVLTKCSKVRGAPRYTTHGEIAFDFGLESAR